MTDRRPILLPAATDQARGPEQPEVPAAKELPLAAPKMFTRGFLIVCGVVAVILAMILYQLVTTPEMVIPWWLYVTPAVAVALLVGLRWILIPKRRRVIRFHADHVELPKGRNSRRTYQVPYEQIQTLVPLVSRGQPALVMQGPKKTHVFLAPDFEHKQGWRVLWAQLINRISHRPDGSMQLAQMRQLSEVSQDVSSTKPRFTRYLLWTIALIFGAQLLLSPPVPILELLYFGANSSVMVFEQGQWWRVVTANLLHGNAIHFGVNAFALYFLGTYCERLFGEGRTIVLTLGTALAGAAASLVGTEAMFAVGISTALFGLLGAYFALHLKFGRRLPPPYRQSWLWWGVILGINGVLSVAVPIIDAWGHFGGFVGGVVIGWAMCAGEEHFRPRWPAGWITNLIAAALVALFVVCAAIGVGYATGDHPEDELAFAEAVQRHADVEEPVRLMQVVDEWSRHLDRPEQLGPVLAGIAEAAYDRGEDVFTRRRSAQAIVRIAGQLEEPQHQEALRSGLVRLEKLSGQVDDSVARAELAVGLVDWFIDFGTLQTVESPFEGAEWVDDQVRLTPEADVDEPLRVYLLVIEQRDDRRVAHAMLDRCVPAGEAAGYEPAALDRDVEGDVELAMVVGAQRCIGERANVWRVTGK